MTNEEMYLAARHCVTNMVNSMQTWDESLLLMFYQHYTTKFCLMCGRKRTWFQDLRSPCVCEDTEFMQSLMPPEASTPSRSH